MRMHLRDTDFKKMMKRLLPYFFVVGLFAAGLVLTVALRAGAGEQISLEIRGDVPLSQAWVLKDKNREYPVSEFPFTLQEKEAVFYNILPAEISANDILVFDNRYQGIEVTVDGESIYEYGMDTGQPYFMPANIKCYVKLLPEYAGKQIEIRIHASADSGSCMLTRPLITNLGEIVWNTIGSNLMQVVYCILMGAVGCVGLLLVGILRWKRQSYGVKIFEPLGFFMLVSAVWVFTDSGLSQLLLTNSQIAMVISFEAFMLLPIPLLRFMGAVSRNDTSILKTLQLAFALNCILQNVLYTFQVSDFIQMLFLTHILDILSIFYIIYFMIKESIQHKSSYARGILAAICVFVCVASISLVTFYKTRGNDNSRFFVLGSLLMNVIFLVLSVGRYMQFSQENAKLKVYQELAYKDVLTGMGNRTLYEAQVSMGDDKLEKGAAVTAVLLDINGLKTANDRYGHGQGDCLIRQAAECIQDTFGERGQYFRIGGDEFVVIVWGEELAPEEYQERLRARIEEMNKHRELPLSISAGFASAGPKQTERTTMSALVREADEKMYGQKKAFYDLQR